MKISFRLITAVMLSTIVLFTPASAADNTQNNQRHRRLKVGLVLSGGGAKGAAHAGALRAIEQSGIPIDYIAGTSIGAIVGGLYACGYRSADIEKMFRSQQWNSLLSDREMDYKKKPIKKKNGITYLFGYPIDHKGESQIHAQGFGAFRGDHVIELLDSMTNRRDSILFTSLPIPFQCVAVDVNTLTEVIFDRGKLSTAMRASMAIPGAFRPIVMGDSTLIDGGALNNLPVDVVRKMGADVVIAIDLTQNKHESHDRTVKHRKSLSGRIIQWIKARPDITKYNASRANCEVYINPDLRGYDATSFVAEKIDTMIARGQYAGEQALPQILALKKKVMKGKQVKRRSISKR